MTTSRMLRAKQLAQHTDGDAFAESQLVRFCEGFRTWRLGTPLTPKGTARSGFSPRKN
jgi:hypothetical protein